MLYAHWDGLQATKQPTSCPMHWWRWHQQSWFRALALRCSAGGKGIRCSGSPKTVILRRAPDRLSTISTTGSYTGQTTMLCTMLCEPVGASLALDRQRRTGGLRVS